MKEVLKPLTTVHKNIMILDFFCLILKLWKTLQQIFKLFCFKSAGKMRVVSRYELINPPRIHTAKGFAVSEPIPVEKEAGIKPIVATELEMKILLNFSQNPCTTSFVRFASEISIIPVRNETPITTIIPAAAEILRFS